MNAIMDPRINEEIIVTTGPKTKILIKNSDIVNFKYPLLTSQA